MIDGSQEILAPIIILKELSKWVQQMAAADDEEKYVNTRESDLRWDLHKQAHEKLDSAVVTAAANTAISLRVALEDHHREHTVHEQAHEREHLFTKDALDKADLSLERRLEGMNEFRAQLERQAGQFLDRDAFNAYATEQTEKQALALATSSDKYDTIMKAIVSRHETDMEAIREEIQNEREVRKTFEGSINTWKWIASFLGASGVAGVILLFATRAST